MERKLTAILSADVKGYSRLMGEDEEATIRTLTAYREVITTFIQQYHGRVVDSPGDNLLAEFASVVDAARCAIEIQGELQVRNVNLPARRRMEFRIGINVGDVIVEGEKIYGDGVNIAARLEGLAEPGGICISGTVHDQIENKLALSYEYLGEQTVKNIAKPVRVWRVQVEESSSHKSQVASQQDRRVGSAHHPWALPSLSTQDSALSTQAQLALPDKPSIAVLPFVNLSSDPEQEYFSDGITEDLITDLSKLSGLFVIARNSTFVYKGKAAKVQEVSKELGVRYVLEGSVRKASNRLRITAQLVDATTSHHVWAERYDRELRDIFALQDEITQKIVLALKVKLTEEEQARFRRAPTDNLEAYDAFLRAEAYFWRYTQEAHAQARQLYERALALDPQYAAAHASLAVTYLVEWIWQWSQDPQTLDRALVLAQRAIALDNSLPVAHRVLGAVYLLHEQYEQAIAEGERALSLDPNDADAYVTLAMILNFVGRLEDAIGLIEQATRLNLHYPAWYAQQLGIAYRLAGRYEEAAAAHHRALALNPDFLAAHLGLAAIYAETGQEAKARTAVAEVLRINPHFSLEALRRGTPLKDRAAFERFRAALRKAGLK